MDALIWFLIREAWMRKRNKLRNPNSSYNFIERAQRIGDSKLVELLRKQEQIQQELDDYLFSKADYGKEVNHAPDCECLPCIRDRKLPE